MGRILRKKPAVLKKKKQTEAGSAGVDTDASGARIAETAKSESAETVRKPEMKRAAASPPAVPADNVLTRALQFLREVKIELKKVTWPTRKQTMGSTLVVIVLVMIISLFLGLVDLGLSTVVRAVFRA
jgi:preprotein translocase subunit SecE